MDTKKPPSVPCANTQSHGTKLQGQKMLSNMNTTYSTKNQKVTERKGFQCMEPGTSLWKVLLVTRCMKLHRAPSACTDAQSKWRLFPARKYPQ